MKLTIIKPTVFESFDDQDNLSDDDSSYSDVKQRVAMLARKFEAAEREMAHINDTARRVATKMKGTRMLTNGIDVNGNRRIPTAVKDAIANNTMVRVSDLFVVVNSFDNQDAIHDLLASYKRYQQLERLKKYLQVKGRAIERLYPT